MSQNLALFGFNNRANIATSDDGWYVEAGVVVDALAGADKILAIVTSLEVGIDNEGTINTGKGNDAITGTSTGDDGIDNVGTISTGKGNDTITGIAIRADDIDDGIDNVGTIDTGNGYDTITGTSIGDDGIDNEGTIDTGKGDDTITGTSYEFGTSNEYTIHTGKGDDTITGTSISSHGIDNLGTIDTGKGDDTITGISIDDDGIYNEGTINTGKGSDVVNALEGRFGGNGDTYLGGGSDTIKGFGTGNFYGGNGIDKMLFSRGTYIVSDSVIVSDGMKMNVNEFENIGGANGGLFALKDGTLTVDSSGVGTFA